MVNNYKYYVYGHYPWSCLYLKHNVYDIGFCLRLQVKPNQLGPIDRASSFLRRLVLREDGDRIQFPKRCL
jgi:hypothetical protein